MQYLEAVDQGHQSTTTWETRPRLLARELRRQRDGLFGFPGPRLLAVRSWPGINHLTIEAAGSDGVHWYQIPVPDDRTDGQIVAELSDFDPLRYDGS